MKKYFVLISLLIVSFLTITAFAQTLPGINLNWNLGDESTAGYKIYYDNDGINPLDGIGSPIIINDPNQTSILVEDFPYGTWYFKLAAFNVVGTESPLTAVKVYQTIQQLDVVTPGTFVQGQSITTRIVFPELAVLVGGNMFVTFNNGIKMTVTPEMIPWTTQVDLTRTIGANEVVDPLVITNVYLDPNDPDVILKNSNNYPICTDIINGTNLDKEPNNLITIVGTPGVPSGFNVSCCTE